MKIKGVRNRIDRVPEKVVGSSITKIDFEIPNILRKTEEDDTKMVKDLVRTKNI